MAEILLCDSVDGKVVTELEELGSAGLGQHKADDFGERHLKNV